MKTSNGIAWYDEGSGSPVLLVMGLAYPAAAWFRQVPVLAEQHRVLTVDNRGAGETGLVDGAPTASTDDLRSYTVEQMTQDCLDVLDDAGVDQAHVVGISMGGLMAAELGLSHPDRVRSVTLMSTHPGIAQAVMPAEVVEFLGARASMPADERGEFSIPFNYHPSTSRDLIAEDWAAREAGTAGPEGYAAQGGTALWSGWDRFPTMSVPTQVVHGAQDRLVVPANGEKIASRVPGSRLVLIEGGNHIVTTDQADEVNRVLLAWFAEHDA